ncbi:MAG: toprim domain-containing protein [Parafilimonas sp.]
MTCAEANKVDLVEYLFSLGFTPSKIRGNDYWYLSPYRNEKDASFKINKIKNIWYDHGVGKGGDVVDFITSYFSCGVSTALQKLSSLNYIPKKHFIATETPNAIIFPEVSQPKLLSEQTIINQQIQQGSDTTNQYEERPPFHLHENSLINHRDVAETAIEIIAAKQPITDMVLCRYLEQRRVDKSIADRYCYEVQFKFSNKENKYTAIGFKNSAGGYELRDNFFKQSSSPKYITYITNAEQNGNPKTEVGNNNSNTSNGLKNENKISDEKLLAQPLIVSQNDGTKSILKNEFEHNITDQNQATSQAKSVAVFEGFFDFLSYQKIHQNQTHPLTNFLVLNSTAFFERRLLLMEKHDGIHLYFDQDNAGKKCLDIALKRSVKYKDESILYNDYKDLNDWVINFEKLQQKQYLKVSNKNRLLKTF